MLIQTESLAFSKFIAVITEINLTSHQIYTYNLCLKYISKKTKSQAKETFVNKRKLSLNKAICCRGVN